MHRQFDLHEVGSMLRRTIKMKLTPVPFSKPLKATIRALAANMREVLTADMVSAYNYI